MKPIAPVAHFSRCPFFEVLRQPPCVAHVPCDVVPAWWRHHRGAVVATRHHHGAASVAMRPPTHRHACGHQTCAAYAPLGHSVHCARGVPGYCLMLEQRHD